MRKLLIFAALCLFVSVSAQNKGRVKKVAGVEVVYKDHSTLKIVEKKAEFKRFQAEPRKTTGSIPRETTYIDFSTMKFYQMACLPTGDTATVITPFEYNKNLKVIRSEKLLGWDCKVAQTVVNSNTIEIWYTDNIGLSGTPMPSWGVPEGLVLKVVRNANVMLEAETVERTTVSYELFPDSWGEVMDAADYRYTLNNSVVKTVEVFRNDRLHFTGDKAPENFDQTNHIYRVGGGTVLLKKVKLPENVDGYSIFAELSQFAVGDAYDRTGSVFMIPVGKEKSFLDAMSSRGLQSVPSFVSDTVSYPGLISTPQYDVPVELMRFYTSFGVRGYNHINVKGQAWADSIIYKSEVTHLAPLLKGEVWIGSYIGNWDSKGHDISLKLKYHPAGGRNKGERVVIPLFNTLNILEQAGQKYPVFFGNDSLRVDFAVPENLVNAKIVYITTGHGGWGGGDEFNQKLNTIYFDGGKIFSFIPWREDCASYRNSNPASGNFSNGLSSSDLSRSNWCPGTVTNPVYVPIGDLMKGDHKVAIQIPQGKPEGGSFSYWCVSGFIIAEMAE